MCRGGATLYLRLRERMSVNGCHRMKGSAKEGNVPSTWVRCRSRGGRCDVKLYQSGLIVCTER